jgi:cytochrome o ubiquinol oxidase operon protein cyoD
MLASRAKITRAQPVGDRGKSWEMPFGKGYLNPGEPVLARARHHLGGIVHRRLSLRNTAMSEAEHVCDHTDVAPGDESRSGREIASSIRTYVIGFTLVSLLTVVSFSLPATHLVWAPGVPVALIVFAIAQMGVHLVFFLHITTAPDNTNNVLALAFGVLIVVTLIIAGSLWIIANLNHNMAAMDVMMNMER